MKNANGTDTLIYFRSQLLLELRVTKQANDMAKRRAVDLLEDVTKGNSPSTKKVRVESVPEKNAISNGFSPSSAAYPSINGRKYEED